MELDVGTQQIFGHVRKRSFAGKTPIHLMQFDRRIQPPQTWRPGAVISFEIEASILRRRVTGRFHELTGHGIEFVEPLRVNQRLNRHITVVEIPFPFSGSKPFCRPVENLGCVHWRSP